MEKIEFFEKVLSSTEYENICDGFSTISKLFVKYFSLVGNSSKSELESLKASNKLTKSDLQRRLTESKEADEIINEIKRILTVGTSENPSLKTRIRSYINKYNNQLINIDIANRLTQSLVLSLVYVFQSYQINKNKFDNIDENVFVNDLLDLLKNNAIELNRFLFEQRKSIRQRQPLYTIFDNEDATHFNTTILPEIL
jgi:hypothetical protein